ERLGHWEGYQQSPPVRIGNGAYNQLQLDIYGELMDAVYLYNKYGAPISHDLWLNLTRLLNWVCDHWHLPDAGIWEVRGGLHENFLPVNFSVIICVYAAACWGNHNCSHCWLSSTTFKMPSALLPVGLQLIPLCFCRAPMTSS